ncbi:hypothetical protein TNCV_1759521 [Trichonephila clavipes]|nr:hypothetical protein TNCV_1759521 [Trichonephila clavipes]
MFDSSSYVNPTPLAHVDASRDVLPPRGEPSTAEDTSSRGGRCTLNMSKLEHPRLPVGVLCNLGEKCASSVVILVTSQWFTMTRAFTEDPRVAEYSATLLFTHLITTGYLPAKRANAC